MPVAPGPAFHHGEIGWLAAKHSATFVDTFAYTQWFNLLGCPAAAVPMTQSEAGLPIGVQIVGRPFKDELVLAIAKLIESHFCLNEAVSSNSITKILQRHPEVKSAQPLR
jgi:Asp-tRNA(Asn)/Glu-tRNA(Gln) amidotransferase A subunit family amidase